MDFEKAVTKAIPAVVHIKTVSKARQVASPRLENSPFREFFGDGFEDLFGQGQSAPQVRRGSGSGEIITGDGYVVTNNHVVDGADELMVTLSNNKSYKGKVIGTDPSSDLAVIKIDAANLPYLTFANSDEVRLGQWVLAIGYPLLAKIENRQYLAEESINLTEITKKYLRLFDEIMQDKNLRRHTDFQHTFTVRIHPFLADSLVSHLLGNAIKYNQPGGEIYITTTEKEFCIRNTSPLPAIDPQQLFKRFQTAGTSGESSTGLGLAIVKRIVENNGLAIHYSKEGALHRFCLTRS